MPSRTPAKAARARTAAPVAPKARRSGARGADPAKRASTKGSRLTITILAGLAVGLVAMLVWGTLSPKNPWVFDSPAAKLPSLQTKHTLY
jgi:hypothetical protein